MRNMSRRMSVVLLAAGGWLAGAPGAGAQATLEEAFGAEIRPQWQTGIDRQYDFWLGEWTANWRPRQPEQFWNADQGQTLEHWLFPILDGKAMIELSVRPDRAPSGTHGFSLRYFDPAKDRWVMAQNWPGENASGGFLDQLQGFERFGRIMVLSTYHDRQRDIDLTRRYEFVDIRDGAFRWESSRTWDNGQTWLQGTIVEFSRTRPVARLGAAGDAMPNFGSGEHCTEERFKRFDGLEGVWEGTVTVEGREHDASFTGSRFLGGCAVMGMARWEAGGRTRSVFSAYTVHDSGNGIELRLDGERGTPHTYFVQNGATADDWTFGRNDGLRIKDEFSLEHTTYRTPLLPEAPLSRIVWTEHGPDRFAYRIEERTGDTDPWSVRAEFAFARR